MAIDEMSVKELKKLIAEAGLSSVGLVEKSELRERAREARVRLEDVVPCVKVDTIGSVSANYGGYEETRVPKSFLERMRWATSEIAGLCGLELKIYFQEASPGWRQTLRTGQEPDLSRNNGAASFLLKNVDDGLSDWIVSSPAYVVLNDGDPITKGQVWGLQEMVNCAMDIYDMSPENMERGKATVLQWATQYRARTWEPRSGTGGVSIYGPP